MKNFTEKNQSPQSYIRALTKKEKTLMIIALAGEFPFHCASRLDFTDNYERLIRHQLSQEEKIQMINGNGLKGITLTKTAADDLRESNPERYKYIADRNRTELNRRFRKQLSALTYCSLTNADIEFLPDKKPFIYARSRTQSYSVVTPLLVTSKLSDKPIFYSSVEIKYELERVNINIYKSV